MGNCQQVLMLLKLKRLLARKHLQFISVSCLYFKVCKPFNVLKLHCVGKYWLTQRSVFCMNLEGNQKRCNKFDLISMTAWMIQIPIECTCCNELHFSYQYPYVLFQFKKKNVKKYPINALATICNPHPPFHFFRPSSFEKCVHCFMYMCVCIWFNTCTCINDLKISNMFIISS